MMRPDLQLPNMHRKLRSLVFFKVIIKFATFKACVFLPEVRIGGNRLSGKNTHPIKINAIIVRENLCIV